MAAENPDVSIILPVYNQAGHIEDAVNEYLEMAGRIPAKCEFILVPNGCRDDSPGICAKMAEANPSVRVVESEQAGWGRAVRTGISSASADLVCYTNSARTHSKELALVLTYATIYPDVVVKAERRIRDGIVRRLGSLIYNLECRCLFDIPSWDINGTPKVFPRKFDKLLALSRDDDLIDLEFNVICREEGYPIIEVPVISTRRHAGRSTTGCKSAVRMYLGALALRRSRRRGE